MLTGHTRLPLAKLFHNVDKPYKTPFGQVVVYL